MGLPMLPAPFSGKVSTPAMYFSIQGNKGQEEMNPKTSVLGGIVSNFISDAPISRVADMKYRIIEILSNQYPKLLTLEDFH